MLENKIDNSKLGITKKDELQVLDTSQENITWRTGAVGEKIWMGSLTVAPSAESNVQHHAQSNTVHYVLNGQASFFYGKGYKKVIELNEGDFIYIPSYQPYMYQNNNDATPLQIITTMAPSYQLEYLNKDDIVMNSENDNSQEEISVVKSSDLMDSTSQTKNMPRKTAVQAPNLWIGRVTGETAMDSGTHHHGEAETAGFIISGTTELLYGEGYEDYEKYNQGDFLRVPAYLPHIERNPSKTEPIEFLTARNPRNVVVNID
ncbi:cupin domain-containing protein [Oceanobacillus sp. FSL W7-1281]|uniref:cupin domain-containing protein n=1 Tax=Oceanobacillus sp. FSL W7-1281 TaxID=2921698 RepID=UPI0030DCAA08